MTDHTTHESNGFTPDFEGKIKREMAEHWEMSPEVYDQYRVGKKTFMQDGTWMEASFVDEDGTPAFYIEVNEKNEVWNFEYI